MSLPPMPPRPNRPSFPGAPSGPTPPPVPPVRSAALPHAAPQPVQPEPQPEPVAVAPEPVVAEEPATPRPQPRVVEETKEGGLTSKKPLVIGGGVAAGLLLFGGVAFAYNALAPAPGGPEDAVPASAVMFAKVDLDPSADQKVAFMQLKDKFPTSTTEEEDTSFKEIVSGAFFDDLDFDTEVDPWIGDRFGVAALESEDDYSSAHMVAVYSITDAGKAEEAAAKITDPSYIYDGKYLVISDSEESLEVWQEDIEKGTLAESKDYRDDMNHLDGDTIASMWADMERINTLTDMAAYQQPGLVSGGGMLQESVKGSLVGGVHLKKDAVQVQFLALGTGMESEIDLLNGNVSDVNNLPQDAVLALAVANLDKTLGSIWTEHSDQIDEYTLQELNALGLSLPEDFTRIVGSQSALGISDFGQNGEPSGVVRLNGADEALLRQLAEDADPSDMAVLGKDGETVTLSIGAVGEGKLGDNENFKKAVPNRDKALAVGYVDIDALMVQTGSPESEESYGVVGASVSYDQKKDIGDLTIRWVFND